MNEHLDNEIIIAIAELNDQFSVFTNIEIIEKTDQAIVDFKEKYKNIEFYFYNTYFFKTTYTDFEYLKSNLDNSEFGQDNIREWIEERS